MVVMLMTMLIMMANSKSQYSGILLIQSITGHKNLAYFKGVL